MQRSSRFLLLTVAFDLVLLALIGLFPLPGPPVVQAAVALFVVSPMLTYLVVYHDDYRGPFR